MKITPTLFFCSVMFHFSCSPKNVNVDENLSRKWAAIQHKFHHLEHHGYEPNLLTRDQWGNLFEYSICVSKEWVDLVKFLKANPEAQVKLLRIFETSKATYDDLYFKLVHMIPCLLYESKGGNLKGLISHKMRLETCNTKTLEILLDDEVKYSDYGDFEKIEGFIDYGTPIEMPHLMRK